MKKISHFLIRNFELKQQEISIFLLLFLHSFFLGLSIAFYFVPANSEFIKNYGSEQLPLAYIISGISGYIITAVYSAVQKRLTSRSVFLGALLFMMFITLIGRLGVPYVNEEYLSFFVFIWAWPFISLVGIETGGLSLKFLNLVQVKRIFGLFNMGGVLAAIIGYLTVPFLNKIIGHTYDLLFISLGAFVVSIFLLLLMFKKFPEKDVKQNNKFNKTKTSGFFKLIKEKYFRLIFISVTLSMMTIYITDFGFLSSVKIHIPKENVSKYLALVYAGLKIGELFISYFSSRILSKYGVKLGLTILPLASTAIVLTATIIGLISGAEVILFLVLMTINKSLERILRRGLDDPAFNILYQPLPDDEKLSVQTKVGVVMQISIAVAGVFLLATNYVLVSPSGFLLKYFPLIFLPVLVAWVIVSQRLYQAYKDKIRQILVDISKDKRKDTSKYTYGSEILKKNLKKTNQKVVNLSATILSETNPRLLEPYATSLLDENDMVIQKAVLRNIDPTWRVRLLNPVEKLYQTTLNTELRLLAEIAKDNLDYKEIKNTDDELVKNLTESEFTADKLKLIKYIYRDKIPAEEKIIINLLTDTNRLVKAAAITLVTKSKSTKLISELVKYLESAEYYNIAGNALLDIGDKVLPELETLFADNKPVPILLRVIELLAKFGSAPARNILVKYFNYPNREIQMAIIYALYFCRYQAEDKDVDVIKARIQEVVDNILWIYSTIIDIEEEKNTLKLYLALDNEKENNFELLFQLLSFIYEPRIIALIQKNIIGKNTIFALEIIDNFFSPDLKKIIAPLFDDISSLQKIRKLNTIFPQKRLNLNDRLKEIIKREYNKLDSWTVTKAIELLGRMHKTSIARRTKSNVMDYKDLEIWNKDNINDLLERIRKSEMPDEIFVCLFHYDELVYSTAAKIIYDENPIKCFDYLINMSPAKQQLMSDLSNSGIILNERVKLLKRHPLFFNVPEKLLVKMAKLVVVKEIKKGEEITIRTKSYDENIIIIMKGTLVTVKEQGSETYFFKYDIVTRGINIDYSINNLIAKKDCTLLFINRFEYFNLLVNETEMIRHIFTEVEVVEEEN